MKKLFSNLLILSLFFSVEGMAYPILENTGVDLGLGSVADAATQLLKDSEVSGLYYVSPKRVVLAEDPLTKRKLFRLSLLPGGLGAELMAVFRLGFDETKLDASWKQILASNPAAELRPLPVAEAKLGLEFETDEFRVLVGQADGVTTQVVQGIAPLFIKVNQQGLDLMRLSNATIGKKLLTLSMNYRTRLLIPGEPLIFTFSPKALLTKYRGDSRLQAAFSKSQAVPEGELVRWLVRDFASSSRVWFASGEASAEFNLLKVASLLRGEVQGLVTKALATCVLTEKACYEQLNPAAFPSDPIEIRATQAGEPKLVSDSSAMVLAGVCEKYRESIHLEENGESECLSLPVATVPNPTTNPNPGGTPNDVPWIPDF